MIWFAFIAFEILRNYALIEWLGLRPHYGYSALIRCGFGAYFLFTAHPEFDPLGDVTTIFPTVNYALFQWTSFYLLFDVSLNVLRRKPWDYRGANSGKLDKLSKKEYYALKIGSAVILALALILIL